MHKKICRSNDFFDRQVPKVLVLAIACLNLIYIYIVKIINNKYDYDNKSNAYSFLRDGTGMTGIYSVMCNHCGITIYISAWGLPKLGYLTMLDIYILSSFCLLSFAACIITLLPAESLLDSRMSLVAWRHHWVIGWPCRESSLSRINEQPYEMHAEDAS